MLIKKCVLASAVEIECFEIQMIRFFPVEGAVHADVSGWVSEKAKAEGASPAWSGTFNWQAKDAVQLATGAISLAEAKLSGKIDDGEIR